MKKLAITILIFMLAVNFSFAGFSVKYRGKHFNLSEIKGQVNYLLAKHSEFLKNMQARFSRFEKHFFRYTGFMNETATNNFFKRIQYSIRNRTSPRAQSGIIMISYTSVISINGNTKAVSYSYSSNGKKIRLIKQTYNNGSLLKADYEYNIYGRLLRVKEYKGNRLIQKRNHKLII